MIGGSKPRGYTVVEVLIFLAVTSILGVSAMTLINGQQRKTEFAQTVREFDSTIRDIINDVSTGYYPNTDRVKCTYVTTPGTGINLTELSGTFRGTNSDCIFIGRVIQFAPSGTSYSGIRVYTVAGQRLTTARKEVVDVLEAQGKLIAKGPVTTPDVSEDINFGGSIRIARVRFEHSNPAISFSNKTTNSVGFFTSFSSYSGSSSFLKSGSSNTVLVPIANNTSSPVLTFPLNQSATTFVTNMNRHLSPSPPPTPSLITTSNPTRVEICLLSQVTKQRAILMIGEYGRQLSTNLTITDDTTCP